MLLILLHCNLLLDRGGDRQTQGNFTISKKPEPDFGQNSKLWKGSFWFLRTGIFGITSGGSSLISVGIFQPKFAVPFLTNQCFALIKEFRKGIKSDKSHSYWLARFNRKMSFHYPRVFPLISDRLVWHKEIIIESTRG